MANTTASLIVLAALGPFAFLYSDSAAPLKNGPEYTGDGQLTFPENYREWIFLSSGVGMTYGPLAQADPGAPPSFDNIFVNPEAYRAFLESGRWPDKTMLVMEVRRSESHASINRGGRFQSETVGIEANVKDKGEWNFYGFNLSNGKPQGSAKALPHSASCFTCHGVKTAVENTFVQFYPSLYAVAERKNTFNPGFERLPVTPNQVMAMIMTEGWEKASIALRETASSAPDSTVLAEATMNSMAYQLMASQHNQEAVSMLEVAAMLHQKSANLQDSLAEAYEKVGNAFAARAATEKSLALLNADPGIPEDRRQRLVKAAGERLQRLR